MVGYYKSILTRIQVEKIVNNGCGCACNECGRANEARIYYSEGYEEQFESVCSDVAESMERNGYARICANDSRLWLRDDTVYCVTDSEYYTREYAETWLYYCQQCGEYYAEEDFDESAEMCRDCAERYIIGEWHSHKHSLNDIRDKRDTAEEAARRIGFELEIDRGHSATDCAREIRDAVGENAVFFEYDGSLYDGFEIITQPHSARALESLDIERMCDIALSYDYRSHDTDTCGLHIHFSEQWLGTDTTTRNNSIERITKFYALNFKRLFKLSRRSFGGNWTQYAAADDWKALEKRAGDCGKSVAEYKIDQGRYHAVNCSNMCDYFRGYDTIEFRLARGTLKAATIRAWIDLHIALLNSARTGTATFLWDEWTQGISDSTREWIRERMSRD